MRKRARASSSNPEGTPTAGFFFSVFVLFLFLFSIKRVYDVSYVIEVKAQGKRCTSEVEHLATTPKALA